MKTIRYFLLLAFVLLVSVSVVLAQEPPPQLDLVLADLSTRLGHPVSKIDLASWNFTQARYTDTAFGCPLVAGEARPDGIAAYTFTITLIGGTSYEYRVALDNSSIFPCDQTLLNATPPPPVATTPCPADFAGLLPSRLDIGARAQVSAGEAPLRLRRAPNTSGEQITQLNPGTVVEVVGGPSCEENFVWWQIVANGQTGWAAEGAPPDEYFLSPINAGTATPTGAVLLLATPTLPPTVTPQGGGQATEPGILTVTPQIAGVTENGDLKLYIIMEDGRLAEAASIANVMGEFSPMITDITWSPNGAWLAYVMQEITGDSVLYIVPIVLNTPAQPVEWARGLLWGMPVTFSADSSTIFYAKPGDTSTQTGPEAPIDLFAHPLNLDAQPARMGMTTFGSGCGGGSPFPGDAALNTEAGYMGSGLVFEYTVLGIYLSTNCTGSGLAFWGTDTNGTTVISDSLGRAHLTADGTRIAGVAQSPDHTSTTLTVVDAANLQQTPLGTVAMPDQTAWGTDGSLFYSVRTNTGQAIPGTNAEPFLSMGFQSGVPLYQVSIHRVDLTAATDAEIYSTSAYTIGRMFATPGNLFFSTIPNGEAWVQQVQTNPNAIVNEVFNLFTPTLYRLDLATGQVSVVADKLYMATPNPVGF